MKKPLIYICNDDGYDAKGINCLIEMVKDLGDVFVVAPDSPRSGSSLSFTSHLPLRAKLIRQEPGITVYSCSGTPCDCVKLAFEKLLPSRPDIVLAGINHGDNASINAHYSGTMAIALEGTMKQVPSVGLSLADFSAEAEFTPMTDEVRRIVKQVLAKGLPKDTYLNVNFPATPPYKGVRICRMGNGEWINELEERCDPRSRIYYWITGSFVDYDANDLSTDLAALNDGYITVTPLKLDLTAYETMDQLRELLGK